MGEVTVQHGAMPSTGGSTAKTAKEVFWLSVTALLTLGVPLLDLPNVLERGGADARSVELCLQSWKAILEGPGPWLKSSEINDFVIRTVEGETARLLETRAQPVVVRVDLSGATQRGNADALRELAHQLLTDWLVLSEISVGVEPLSPGCRAQLQANASLQLVDIEVAAENNSGRVSKSLSAVSRSEIVDVHGWATEPEVGRLALRLALLQLASAIVESYPWPVGEETKSPALVPGSSTR